MRGAVLAAIGGMLMSGVAACARSYDVHTVMAPDASVTSLRTFRVLPVPPRRDGRAGAGSYDPMVDNSITNRALRATIADAFAARGYLASEHEPDFVVAVYASASEALDVTRWDYGYPHWPRHGGPPWPAEQVVSYTEGTVIVDVVDPRSRELIWRGSGSTRMSEDPSADTRELQRVARAVVRRFPKAARRVLARAP